MKTRVKFNFSPDVEPHFAHSLDGILGYRDSFKRLSSDLKRFESTVPTLFSGGAEGNERAVRRLISLSREMLKLCQCDPTQPFVPYCLAAISYFLDNDDGIPDFQSYDSFDDDEEVFREVVKHFDLALPPIAGAA